MLDRRVDVTPTKRGVHVTVTPSLPYGHRAQRNTRERFGWFPVARKRLDYLSRADFRIARPATVRVALVDKRRLDAAGAQPAAAPARRGR